MITSIKIEYNRKTNKEKRYWSRTSPDVFDQNSVFLFSRGG